MDENNKKQGNERGSRALKGRRETFAQIMSAGNTSATEAARQAGYSDNNGLRRYAHELATNIDVKDRIAYLSRETAEKMEITREKVIADILEAQEIAREKKDAANILRGAELKGKALGIFTDRIIHEGEQDELSQERLEEGRRLAKETAEKERLRLIRTAQSDDVA